MRIINENIHDFYDCVQSVGQDRTLVYLRKPKEIFVNNFPFYEDHGKFYDFYVSSLTIGFCGKLYPVLKIDETYCHNMEDVNSFVEKNLSKKEKEAYFNGKKYKLFKYWTHFKREAEFKEFLERLDKDQIF